jgi:hypothetical protein
MATISKGFLSASTHGDFVKIAATSSAGTLIHQAVNQVDDIDEVWLYACNTNTSAVTLTVEWSSAAVDDNLIVTINPNETVLVAPGIPLRNNLEIKGFATVANKVNCFGYVNHIVV